MAVHNVHVWRPYHLSNFIIKINATTTTTTTPTLNLKLTITITTTPITCSACRTDKPYQFIRRVSAKFQTLEFVEFFSYHSSISLNCWVFPANPPPSPQKCFICKYFLYFARRFPGSLSIDACTVWNSVIFPRNMFGTIFKYGLPDHMAHWSFIKR